jgi:hypothetical protein
MDDLSEAKRTVAPHNPEAVSYSKRWQPLSRKLFLLLLAGA